MTELSPEAQAVLDAYGEQVGGSAAITSYERRGIAAALRAAVLQALPQFSTGADRAPFAPILAIAAELEGAQATGSTH